MKTKPVPAPKGYKRKKKIVDPAYQLRYTLTLASLATSEGVLLAGVLLIAVFSVIEISPEDHVRLFYYLVMVAAGTIVILNIINFAVGILLSHRISGPVYRFTQVLQGMIRGDLGQVIMLREKDDLQDLKDRLNDMLESLRQRVREQNLHADRAAEAVRQLRGLSASAGQADSKTWDELTADLEKIKSQFTV